MALIIFILILPISVAAWAVFFLCWKGRQVLQPAACATCGHATGDQPGMLASTCAECGSDLTQPRAVRYFRCERTQLMRAGLVVASILVCISSIVPLAGLAALLIGLGVRMPRPAPPPAAGGGPAPAAVAPTSAGYVDSDAATDRDHSTDPEPGASPSDGGTP